MINWTRCDLLKWLRLRQRSEKNQIETDNLSEEFIQTLLMLNCADLSEYEELLKFLFIFVIYVSYVLLDVFRLAVKNWLTGTHKILKTGITDKGGGV